MQHFDKHQQAGRSTFLSSVEGLANTLSAVVTFFAVPPVFKLSEPFVQTFTTHHYGHGFDELIAIAWWLVCALCIFCFARASLGALLISGGLAVAARVFV